MEKLPSSDLLKRYLNDLYKEEDELSKQRNLLEIEENKVTVQQKKIEGFHCFIKYRRSIYLGWNFEV